jgi:hypothetical protein
LAGLALTDALPNPSATAARERFSLQSAVIGDVFRKQYLHIIADPIAKVIADSTYYVESRSKKASRSARGRTADDFSACSDMRTRAAKNAPSSKPTSGCAAVTTHVERPLFRCAKNESRGKQVRISRRAQRRHWKQSAFRPRATWRDQTMATPLRLQLDATLLLRRRTATSSAFLKVVREYSRMLWQVRGARHTRLLHKLALL